jgi:hypothetical protein
MINSHVPKPIRRVNIDELAAVPDSDRRSRLMLALFDLGRLVPTGAFAVDYSRLNYARLIDDSDVVDALRSGNIDHTRDANERRLANLARTRGIEVITSSVLLEGLGFDETGLAATRRNLAQNRDSHCSA